MELGLPASSSSQGGRVIHPIYAKHSKELKGNPENLSNIIGERRLNVCSHPSAINTRSLSARYSNKNCKTLTNVDRYGYPHRQRQSSEFSSEEFADPKVLSERARRNSGNRTYAASAWEEQPTTSTTKDHITEKNKKSSVEPKRFYQRKFSAFSGIKLPVGKFFKLLRPDLQRRNSCPVINLPELQLTGRLGGTSQSKREIDSEPPHLSHNGEINSQQNLKCRLTKWTSHSELLHLEIKRQNIACELPYARNRAAVNRQQTTVKPPSINIKSNRLDYSNAAIPPNKSSEKSKELDCVRNFTTNSQKPSLEKSTHAQIESDSCEKTVIVVSKNSGRVSDGSSENSFQISRLGTSCYISNIPTSMPSTNNELQVENNDISSIECNNSEKQNSVFIDHVKVINTLTRDQRIKESHVSRQHETSTQQSSELGSGNVEYQEGPSQRVSDRTNVDVVYHSSNLENSSLKTTKCKENHREFTDCDSNDKTRGLIVIQNENLKTKQTINLHKSEISGENSGKNTKSTLYINNDSSKINEQNQNVSSQPIYSSVKKNLNDKYSDEDNHEANSPSVMSSNVNQANSEIATNRTVAYIGSSETLINNSQISDESMNVIAHNKFNCKTNECINFNISRSLNERILNETIVSKQESIKTNQNEIDNKIFLETESKDKLSQNSVVDAPYLPDSLNFGECSSNTSLTDLQNRHITECYNVKLDAPEEVIVAGFHDFCQTTLSLEESIELQDTGTVKRKSSPKGSKINSKTESNDKNVLESERNIKLSQESIGIKPITPESKVEERPHLITEEDTSSDKLLEEIQNSKLLGKMNIKDPDVIEAIRALDRSLMEISEDFPETDTDNGFVSEPREEIRGRSISNITAKVMKEDKIQCDNLIEELMLEDISKRVKNASLRSIKGGIAVTISNHNVQHNSGLDNQNFETDTSSQQNLQHSENNDYWLSRNSLKVSNTISDVSSSNLDELLSDTCCSDTCESEEVKKFNVASDVENDNFPHPVSNESGNTTVVYPLRVSVDHNQDALQVSATSNRTSPCSVDSGTSSHNQTFFVVVAIDFGTTYSGYAFSFTRDPDNIHMMKKWDGGDPGIFNQKTPTTLLLSPEGTFHSFGYAARDYYHDLVEEEAKEWLYFEKFKMALHHSEYLSLDTELAAANGKRTLAVTVFAHALRYFKEHALQELTDQSSTKILNEDVRWVVTVPAIWKQPAKQFMRAAAYKAGIASPDYPEQLLIALEPEAASIYCRRIKLHQLVTEETHFQRSSFQRQKEKDTESEAGSTKSDKDFGSYSLSGQGFEDSFTTGTRYMVVDCGGGTVDITVHELVDKQGALKELQKASGGPYGSIGVDIEFEKLLCDIFGEEFMTEFKAKRPIGFLDLMVAFEARKRNANPYKNNALNISLPFSFVDFYKTYTGLSVETAMKNSSHKDVKWSAQGMLRLEPSAMENLFHKTVENIRSHIENIINQKDINIEHIFLVGGFAESLILQKEIKDSFSTSQRVIIPQGVSLAILKGAVLFGLDPTTINIRRLRMTYGVGVLNRFIHGIHPREKLVVKDGIQWCADVFDKFVVNEQSVDVGDVVLRRYTPAKDGQSCSVIHIYCSEKDNAYFITDNGVKRCATLILDLSESRYVKGREIQTQMMFGDTEIKVSALDVITGKCVKAEVDFLNQ